MAGGRTVGGISRPSGGATGGGGGALVSAASCPPGWTGTYPNCQPAQASAALPVQGPCPAGQTVVSGTRGAAQTTGNQTRLAQTTCPPGATPSREPGKCCAAAGAAAGGGALGGSFNLPGLGGAGAGAGTGGQQPAWTPSALQRPGLTPIDPQAAYDPEIAAQLARHRSYTQDLKDGTGFAMDVLTGQQRDLGNAQLREAEQAAAQAGIPFDRARFLMEQQRGIHGAMADEKLGREQMVGQSLGAESGVAAGQAAERTQRLGLDLQRDTTENELALERYGRDIQKYGIDAQAATAANGALMDFYSRLASGMFGMMGNLGSGMSAGGFSTNYNYS